MKNEKKTKSKSKTEMVAWFEIPVLSLERATDFYSAIFNIKFETISTPTHSMAYFPKDSGVGGALVYGDGCIPSPSGSLLYLNVKDELDETLSKVVSSGGEVIMGKTLLGDDIGHYSLVLDSEGNRIALNSKS
jgi:predicted enzyme related to lactoylglutathione lyase